MGTVDNFTVWKINIGPSTFPIAGDFVLAQIPSSNFPGSGWFFVAPCIGTPSNPQFGTQIGPLDLTFNVEAGDKDKASGTVSAPGLDDGTWSAKGTDKPSS